MLTKLSKWIWSGSWLLAFVAGFVNVIGFLSVNHQSITHLTGTTSMLAAEIGQGNQAQAFHYAASILAFLVGTVLSGMIIRDSHFKLGRRYGVVLGLESLLLFASAPMLSHDLGYGIYLAACACGLQNAMITIYSGAVVRTTHLSGMFTDLGIFLGHAMCGTPFDPNRLRLCVIVISGFFIGGVGGTLVFRQISFNALYVPATVIGAAAVIYSVRMAQSRARATN
jgi:uncharacterized membrane protein YoaK (UPF0700 family)